MGRTSNRRLPQHRTINERPDACRPPARAQSMADGCTTRLLTDALPRKAPTFFLLLLLTLLTLSMMAPVAYATEACLRSPESIKYDSPLSQMYTFWPPVNKTEEGLGWIYNAADAFGGFLIPMPKIPAAILTEEMFTAPADFARYSLPNALREFPRVVMAATLGISLALVFPVFGCLLLTCRCCCGTCGGASDAFEGERDHVWKCLCFFSLGICCALMTAAAGFAIMSDLYMFTGITNVLPFVNRLLRDVETLYNKTQNSSLFITLLFSKPSSASPTTLPAFSSST
ncbi:uncharacterized protein LOC142574992 [Dermacentor variabilis]|uniref:uncharacterized protein LOC142574992 n=1 Tax=Dermacentor variabilis TaxID=34621 RepID=UPI003F5BAD35